LTFVTRESVVRPFLSENSRNSAVSGFSPTRQIDLNNGEELFFYSIDDVANFQKNPVRTTPFSVVQKMFTYILHSLSNHFSANPLIQRIHLTLYSLHSIDSQITFTWIPGHIGFFEHDAVDKAAKQVTSSPKTTDIPASPSLTLKIITAHSSKNGIYFGKPNPQINCSA